MDLNEARTLLGVAAGADHATVRAAYRERIRLAHPDIAGPDATGRAARLNEAYALLAQPPAPKPTSVPVPARDAGPPAAHAVGHDTIHLDLPPAEALAVLIDAAHRVGEVTYIDRSSAIFETVVVLSDGQSYSLLVTLHERADGTDALCTLEAMERVASVPVDLVVDALMGQIGEGGARLAR